MLFHTRETLIQLANDIATKREGRLLELKAELVKIEEKKSEIERSLHTARVALKRANDYDPILGSDFICPRCWVDDEARNLMSPKPSETKDDIWECSHCGQSITIRRSY